LTCFPISDDFHRGQGYLREQLATEQKPLLGEYDDSDSRTIAQHLEWSRQANIQLWITSWWGAEAREDATTKEVILEHPKIGDHKIALFYETIGRIKEEEEFSTHRVTPDIDYISTEYFDHPNYFRIDGRPVLFVYLTRKLEAIGILEDVIKLMRQAARRSGHDIFIVGDHAFREAPDLDVLYPPFKILDAVTNYDVYGSMGVDGYAGEEGVRDHYEKQREWRGIALSQGCSFIPSASPGYNDLGVRPEKRHGPLSRRLTPEDKPGSLFKAALREARNLVDSDVQNLLIVNSFNEWHEDTQIEPAVGELTTLPDDLTYGLEYEGYGELYLNILREETLK
jgi:glycoprotein endo-alpha-1,2-mannosidase